MNKKLKTGLVVGGLLLLGAGVAVWLSKRVKSTCKELENREKENEDALKESGLTEEKPREEVIALDDDGTEVDIEVNLPKALNEMISKDSNYLIEAVDVDEFIFGNKVSEHVVHIMQRYDRGLKRNVVDILFEIPLSALWSGKDAGKKRSYYDGNTCVGDFVTTIRGKYNEDLDRVENGFEEVIRYLVDNKIILGTTLKKGKKAKDTIIYSGVSAYITATYERRDEDGEWETITSMLDITKKKLIKENPFNPEHERATEFVCDMRVALDETDNERGIAMGIENTAENSENYRNFFVQDAIAAIRITLAVQDRVNLDGINAATLKQIADHIYNKLEIEGMNGGVFRYEHFLCYMPDTPGEVVVYGLHGKERSFA